MLHPQVVLIEPIASYDVVAAVLQDSIVDVGDCSIRMAPMRFSLDPLSFIRLEDLSAVKQFLKIRFRFRLSRFRFGRWR